MKTFLLIIGIFLVCSSENKSQDSPIISNNSIVVDTVGYKIVPDTTIYETPLSIDLDKQVEKMNILKDKTKQVYDASLKLNEAVIKQKQQAEGREAWQYFKNNLVERPE